MYKRQGYLTATLQTEKIEHRAVINFFVQKGLTPTEIFNEMKNVLGDAGPSFNTVKKWATEFKRGRASLEDDPRTECQKSATTPEIINKVHDIVLEDRRLKVSEIVKPVGISDERVHHILTEELGMKSCLQDGWRVC